MPTWADWDEQDKKDRSNAVAKALKRAGKVGVRATLLTDVIEVITKDRRGETTRDRRNAKTIVMGPLDDRNVKALVRVLQVLEEEMDNPIEAWDMEERRKEKSRRRQEKREKIGRVELFP